MTWGLEERRVRRHRENSDGSDQRTEFERDRDRILYSSAFHRLGGITQIVRAGEEDVFHTRQQHSVKVAQIGRRVAQAVISKQADDVAEYGLDPEVVEAACLAHDLGHPPFGHIGEEKLDQLVTDKGSTDGFEGNAQTFRVLTKIAVRFGENTAGDIINGMDLSRATLGASLKYPWHRADGGKTSKNKKTKKWSAYRSELEDFEFAREFHQHDQKTLEAELMDWSDDVAYSVHDLEDFHRCGAIPWQHIFERKRDLLLESAKKTWLEAPKDAEERLEQATIRVFDLLIGNYRTVLTEPYVGSRDQREQLRGLTSEMIGNYLHAISVVPGQKAGEKVTCVDPSREDEIRILKQITRDYVIGSPALKAQQVGQARIIEDLFNLIFDHSDGKLPGFLPEKLRYLFDLSDRNMARFAADCISSMTESEATRLHARLTGLDSGSVFDPIIR